jgi:hypothetical protein
VTFLDANAAAKRLAMIEPRAIETNGITWLAVHGVLSLGLRHPDYTGPSREIVASFIQELGFRLIEWGVLTEEEMREAYGTEARESPHEGIP